MKHPLIIRGLGATPSLKKNTARPPWHGSRRRGPEPLALGVDDAGVAEHDRIVVAAGSGGLSSDEVAWLLEHAPSDVVVLRPADDGIRSLTAV